ncbi:MAG: fumarylacetoacetate hydrolase family protein [Geminicoccaceae bacterium]|nr:fumarylacetoacetate hydrolase family protein [Geminicoccaceae bacterium]
MQLAFAAAPQITIAIKGSDARFPVHRIYCVGRNYAAHVVEMGGDPDRSEPFFFQKNPDNLLLDNADFPYPSRTSNVHHEVEMVVALQEGGRDIPVDRALDHVFGYAVGIDMTRRDLQDGCKDRRQPWEISKAFDHSAPCGPISPASAVGHLKQGSIWVKVDGETRQNGDLGQMIWKVPEMISYLSGLFELMPGDLIMTGTPSGVSAVERGQTMHAGIDALGEISHKVV